MGKRKPKNNICNRCKESNWTSGGNCRTCAKRNQRDRLVKNRLEPKDKVCTICGTNNWYNDGHCIECSRIRHIIKVNNTIEDSKDEVCKLCGTNAWYLNGTCAECQKQNTIRREDGYVINPKNAICKTCGENNWGTNGRCQECVKRLNSKPEVKLRKNKRAKERYNNDPAERAKKAVYHKVYSKIPEVKIRKRKYAKIYRQQIGYAEKMREYQTEWRKNNRDKTRAIKARRRAKKLSNGGSFTGTEWVTLFKLFNNHCLHPKCLLNNLTYPQQNTEDQTSIHADHILPIVKGGTSFIWNMQPLCKYHNLSKHDTDIDYRPFAIQYLGLFDKIIQDQLWYLFPKEWFLI